jgi:transposase
VARKKEPERKAGALEVFAVMERGKSLREACSELGLAPSSVLRWIEADAALVEQYTRVRETLLDMKAEELEEIGQRAATAETAVEVAGLRLLSDNRKWLLSKLAPKKYGDKLAVGGSDEMPAIKQSLTVEFVGAK